MSAILRRYAKTGLRMSVGLWTDMSPRVSALYLILRSYISTRRYYGPIDTNAPVIAGPSSRLFEYLCIAIFCLFLVNSLANY